MPIKLCQNKSPKRWGKRKRVTCRILNLWYRHRLFRFFLTFGDPKKIEKGTCSSIVVCPFAPFGQSPKVANRSYGSSLEKRYVGITNAQESSVPHHRIIMSVITVKIAYAYIMCYAILFPLNRCPKDKIYCADHPVLLRQISNLFLVHHTGMATHKHFYSHSVLLKLRYAERYMRKIHLLFHCHWLVPINRNHGAPYMAVQRRTNAPDFGGLCLLVVPLRHDDYTGIGELCLPAASGSVCRHLTTRIRHMPSSHALRNTRAFLKQYALLISSISYPEHLVSSICVLVRYFLVFPC